MGTMTKEQLAEHIKTVVLPLIKDTVGTHVADAVREAQERAGPPAWAQAFFEQRHADVPDEKLGKGLAMGAIVRAMAAAKFAGEGMTYSVEVLRGWGYAELAEQIKDYRAKALAAGDATAGGFLVPQQFSQDVIEELKAMAVVRRLNPMIMPMPTGTVRVPKVTAGVTGGYVGENTNITKEEQKFGQVTLSWKKLAALVPISNDLIRYSSPGADAIVRDDVVRALASREDKAFIRDNGSDATPKGMRFWAPASNVIAANGTVSLANTTVDLGKLVEQLMTNNVPMTRPAWIMSPRTWRYLTTVQDGNGNFTFRAEMLTGRLWGWPFGVTTNVPENLTDGGGTNETELYFADMADAVIGEALRLQVDASTEAAYHDGSTVVAAYSQDQTVVRAIAEHDFAMRRDLSVALLNQVTWGA